MDRRREENYRQEDMRAYHSTNVRLRSTAESDKRVESMRRMKRLQEQQQEIKQGEAFERHMQETEHHRQLAEQDKELAEALYEMNHKRQSEALNNRRICEESPELQELKQLLQAAQTNKIRSTQLAEKQLIKQQEATRIALIDQKMEEDRQLALQAQYEEAQKKHIYALQTRLSLQNQIQKVCLAHTRNRFVFVCSNSTCLSTVAEHSPLSFFTLLSSPHLSAARPAHVLFFACPCSVLALAPALPCL